MGVGRLTPTRRSSILPQKPRKRPIRQRRPPVWQVGQKSVSLSAYRMRCTFVPQRGHAPHAVPCTAILSRNAVTFSGNLPPVSTRSRQDEAQ